MKYFSFKNKFIIAKFFTDWNFKMLEPENLKNEILETKILIFYILS